jgi:hypothetical protein
MSCCGETRASLRQEPSEDRNDQIGRWSIDSMDLEYFGNRQLTVTGPLTGTVYRFTGKGARLRIHGSDVPSLVLVPGLRPVP